MDIRRICTRILNILRRNDGVLIVETAVVLPIFIIAVLSIAYVIRYIDAADEINNHLVRESQSAAVFAHFVPPKYAGLQVRLAAGNIQNSNIRLEDCDYQMYDQDTIRLSAGYSIKNRLPLDYIGNRLIRSQIMFRAWVGRTQEISAMPWTEMERDEDAQTVFVFPIAGEKYHRENCSFIANEPVEKLLTRELRKKYKPCKLCGAKNAGDYSIVYCFIRTGEVYHTKDCHSVEKYVIEIERADAEKKGYLPCKKCQS